MVTPTHQHTLSRAPKFELAPSKAKSSSSSTMQLSKVLGSKPQLVLDALGRIGVEEAPNDPNNGFRCRRCYLFAAGGGGAQRTPMCLHVCADKHTPRLSPELVAALTGADSCCCMCRKRVNSTKDHRCRHRMWRWRLVDLSGLPSHCLQRYSMEELQNHWQQLRTRVPKGELDQRILGTVTCALPGKFVLVEEAHIAAAVYRAAPDSGISTVQLLISPNEFGRGLYAAEALEEGQPVCVYSGAMVPPEQLDDADAADDQLLLFTAAGVKQGDDVTWDPRNVGGIAWLANSAHGKSANMTMHSALLDDSVAPLPVGLLVTNRSVKAGEELKWCYDAVCDRPEEQMQCRCGDPQCTQLLVRLKSCE